MRFLPAFTVIAAFLFSCPVRAQESSITLSFPVDCRINETCWVVNYADTDEAKDSARDFTCGPHTYDAHDGTDIAIADRVKMEQGVAILAAAEGTVKRVRDEIDDKQPAEEDIKSMLAERKGCGNGVVIDHGNGRQTIYCHMKKDSLLVKADQKVRAGDKLGLIGQSGAAEFPHLHLAVFHDGKIIDPFTGFDQEKGCNAPDAQSLWKAGSGMDYAPVSLYTAGFQDSVPDFEAIKIDTTVKAEIDRMAPVLAFWAGFFGAQQGDKIRMEILSPDGSLLAERGMVQDKTRARQFYYIGKRLSGDAWRAGEYQGVFRLTRDGAPGMPPLEREIRHTVAVR